MQTTTPSRPANNMMNQTDRAPDEIAAFMRRLAARPLPPPRPVSRRALLRRAQLESRARSVRRRAAYREAPAQIIEVTTYVAVAIATTRWARASWGALPVDAATRWLAELPVALAPGLGVPLGVTTLAALCVAALACLAFGLGARV